MAETMPASRSNDGHMLTDGLGSDRLHAEKPIADKPGIQSVETAAHILNKLARMGVPAKLRDLSAACDMPSGKVHRYLVSMVRSGLAEQVPETGLYRIGSLSISAGLAGLAQTDAVKLAGEALSGLRDATGETAVLAVWSDRGPTVVRLEESARPVTMNIRVGSALPLTRSALGLIFLAFLSSENTATLLKTETDHAGLGADEEDRHTVERVKNVWQHGLSRIEGLLLPGANAIAAPVFDHQARPAAAIGLLGLAGQLDVSWEGKAAKTLRQTSIALSERLGYRGRLTGDAGAP